METRDVLLIAGVVVVVAIFMGASLTGGAFWERKKTAQETIRSRMECVEIGYNSSEGNTPDAACKTRRGAAYSCVGAQREFVKRYYESTNGTCEHLQAEIFGTETYSCTEQVEGWFQLCSPQLSGYSEPRRGDVDGEVLDPVSISCCKIITSY